MDGFSFSTGAAVLAAGFSIHSAACHAGGPSGLAEFTVLPTNLFRFERRGGGDGENMGHPFWVELDRATC
jgi:hypothetical protein